MRLRIPATLLAVAACATLLSAQTSTQIAMLRAEQRRAHTARDLSVLRSGARSRDSETAVMGVRALGRLERPALLRDILLSLSSRLPEVRAEAADAVGQAAQGWGSKAPVLTLKTTFDTLVARLRVDDDPDVRAAVCETIGRLPYATPAEAARAESALVEAAGPDATVNDRLGVAKGLEALVRLNAGRWHPDGDAITLLRSLAVPPARDETAPRIRRLALAALIDAGSVDEQLATRAAADPDDQVRRLAMRAAIVGDERSQGDATGVLSGGVTDPVAMVRIEALRSAGTRAEGDPDMCAIIEPATGDVDLQVALMAIDQLAACGSVAATVADLEGAARELSAAAEPRGWLRPAHALVALARAAPARARPLLDPAVASPVWHLRLYAARAAGELGAVPELQRLVADQDDNVRETAITQLQTVSGHGADPLYIDALAHGGYQVIRAAAYALKGSPDPKAATPALEGALDRLAAEGHDDAEPARVGLRAALESFGDDPPARKGPASPPLPEPDLDELRQLATARARVTIAGQGTIVMALLADQAPLTVLQFARLVESGYYNGLTFHRVVPDFVAQAGSPGASTAIGLPTFMVDEVGRWPHARGAVGLFTRGRDMGDGQFFIDLVDNPRLNHQYTVFAHVLEGMDVADSIVEGDVIEKIELMLGP